MMAHRNLLAKRMSFPCCLVALAAMALVQPATAVPVYNIVPLGLNDLEHTRNDGYKYSYAEHMNEAGQVSGHSNRYNGGSTDLGFSAWLYDGATTINIGLTGSEHTRNDSYKFSLAYELNETGQVRGNSSRFNGGTHFGESAWLYDGATTINIGLTGAEHTRNDGYKLSYSVGVVGGYLNEAGQVSGYSQRFNGGGTDLGTTTWLYDGATTIAIGLTGTEHTRNDGYKDSSAGQLNEAGQVSGNSSRYDGGSANLGYSAWLYDGATTIAIGPTGSEHTRNDGFKSSDAVQLNEAGQVSGNSYRYNGGSTDLGLSAWLYNGTTTIAIGLTGAEHTRNDGYKFSSGQLNEAGQVSGASNRYNGGSTDLGRSVWLYDGATTIDIGLTGAEHTRNDGYKFSLAYELNETGQVSGNSSRYNGGSTDLGQSGWLYDGATTIDIGLTGSEHTRNDGYKYSEAVQLNEAGQVRGWSNRFIGGSYLGRSAWLYNGTTTIDIGLTGSEHTTSSGFKFSDAQQLNEAGQVIGFSYRSNGGNTGFGLGQDGWLYDPVLDQTLALQLSWRSDGYAFSSAAYLGEDGLVIGYYTLFDAFDNNLGDRAFYFTIADGLHDLGSLVEGGLAANGWDFLADAIRANGLGQILGHGKLSSQSGGQMAYLLTPAVPEPSTALLAGLATLMAAFVFRRPRQ